MKKWDGTVSGIKYPFMGDADRWDYQIDDGGTVYYRTEDGKQNIWCPANRLYGHICRLIQIASR